MGAKAKCSEHRNISLLRELISVQSAHFASLFVRNAAVPLLSIAIRSVRDALRFDGQLNLGEYSGCNRGRFIAQHSIYHIAVGKIEESVRQNRR